MDRLVAKLQQEFPPIDELLAHSIASWCHGLPSKEISPADVFTAPFKKELISLGIEEYQLADFLDDFITSSSWVKEYHEVLNEHYSSDYDMDYMEFESSHYTAGVHQYLDGSNMGDAEDVYIRVVNHVEIICPVCWVKEYKETSVEEEDFLDLHYTTHVKEGGWVPEGLE